MHGGNSLRLLLDTHALLWWYNDDPRAAEVVQKTDCSNQLTAFLLARFPPGRLQRSFDWAG